MQRKTISLSEQPRTSNFESKGTLIVWCPLLFCALGDVDMSRTLQEQLVKNGLTKKPIKKRRQKRENKQKKEDLSKRDIEELMGMRRPTYRRRNGAFRQS